MLFGNFEITKEGIIREGFPNWRYRLKSSLSLRPIVSVSFDSRKVFCIVGRDTPIENIARLTELRGTSDLGRSAEELRHQETAEFEGDLAETLRSFGFKVRKNFRSPVGQIDVVAIFRNSILVVEGKKPIFKSDIREFCQDLVEAQEWEEKLERKVEWVKVNKSTVFEQITGKKAETSSLTVDGVIVTYRPFYPLDWKSDILFRYEFLDWLAKLSWTLMKNDNPQSSIVR
jgi:Holliday junction resolvase-like predicted endonuclease